MRRLFSSLPLFVAAFSVFLIWSLLARLENPVALDDGLRHFAMGRLMLEQGIGNAHWSQFFSQGYFAHHSLDPWFLSDIVFMKLVPLGSILALKIFTLLSVGFLLAVLLYALRAFRTPPVTAAIGVLLLMFFEPSFFYRLLVARPYELVTPFALLIPVAAIMKRPSLIALSIALSVLLSQVFLFPLFIACACVLWRLTLREWLPAAELFSWILLGVLLGFFFHPEPLSYATYVLRTFVRIPFIPGIQLGTEMQSGVLLGFRMFCITAVIALLHASLFRDGMTSRDYQQSGLSLLSFLAGFFLLLFLLWTRAIDFLWPILVLLLIRILSLKPGIFQETITHLLPSRFRIKPLILYLLFFMLVASVFAGVQGALYASDETRSLRPYADALSEIPAGSTILNVDWHFFMPAVLVRPDLKYATGIDPSYTYLDNPEALRLLAQLNTPEFRSSPTANGTREWLQQILSEYPSDYLVLLTSRHKEFVAVLKEQLGLKDVSKSEEVAVFDVRTIH